MTLEMTPNVGDWYQNTSGESFEIVAYDATQGLIEIQYFDGTVEEIEIDSWYEQMMVAIEPPEDWSGSLDIERQDYGVDLEESYHLSFDNPLDTFDER
jgi:hypothetical protein